MLSVVLAILRGIVALLFPAKKPSAERFKLSLRGKTVLVTGASSGLGLATACELASCGSHVVLAIRSGIESTVAKVQSHLNTGTSKTQRQEFKGKVSVVNLDLSDLGSVESCMNSLKSKGICLDALILNAARMGHGFSSTKQGLESTVGVNYFGNVHLTQQLLKNGCLAEGCRVCFVSSEAHRWFASAAVPRRPDERPSFDSMSDDMKQYGVSKTLALGYAWWLGKDSPYKHRVHVTAVCPGAVATNIGRNAPSFLLPMVKFVMDLFFQRPEKACLPVLRCIADVEGECRSPGSPPQYFHMWSNKSPASEVLEMAWRKDLVEATSAIIESFLEK